MLGVTALSVPSASVPVTAMDWAEEPQIRRGHMPVLPCHTTSKSHGAKKFKAELIQDYQVQN